MEIHLVYFASVRERLGSDGESVTLPDAAATLETLTTALRARGGEWTALLDGSTAVRFAVNQQFAESTTPLADGCEVAIFPPVTGG